MHGTVRTELTGDGSDAEAVLEVARHAAADFHRYIEPTQVHEVLAARIARDALQVPGIHQRIAVNAHETAGEFLLQRLE